VFPLKIKGEVFVVTPSLTCKGGLGRDQFFSIIFTRFIPHHTVSKARGYTILFKKIITGKAESQKDKK
jgi:hypothetical protein